MNNDTIEINAGNLDNSLEELSDRADAEQRAVHIEGFRTHPADFMVRCNSCGWRRPKSVSEPCPSGHVSGFSYAGPLEEAGEFPNIDVGPLDDNPSPMEVADLAEEVARLEAEATGEPAEDEGPSPEDLADDMGSVAVEKAIMHMFGVQDRLDSAIEDHAEKADVAKTAKKRVESLQEDLSVAVRAVREARAGSEPDPKRYPLLDGPKAEINLAFAKPEAIAPLPADTFEEHFRRESVKTRIDSLILPAKLVELLADVGIDTVDDWRRKREAIEEAGAKVTTIKGLTQPRLEKLIDALGSFGDRVEAGWNAMRANSNVPGTDPAPPDSPNGDPPLEDPNTPIGPDGPASEGVADA